MVIVYAKARAYSTDVAILAVVDGLGRGVLVQCADLAKVSSQSDTALSAVLCEALYLAAHHAEDLLELPGRQAGKQVSL